MSLLVDWQIRDLCRAQEPREHLGETAATGPLIEPFAEPTEDGGVISYGLSHAGYDLRLDPEIWIYKNTSGEVVDPKKFNDENYRARMFDRFRIDRHGRRLVFGEAGEWGPAPLIIPAHGYVLGRSYEYLRIPRYLKGHCLGKSTLARVGIVVNTTPLESEWEGHLTIEIANVSSQSVCVYVMEGIAALELHRLDADPQVSYADKKGKYQGQIGVTPSRVRS